MSNRQFSVITITRAAYEQSTEEVMGNKRKFWFEYEKQRYLYKQARAAQGEDWAEKVASELCKLLGLPHAIYELAQTWEGERGVVSPSFLLREGSLIHGNEILSPIIPNYPTTATYGVSQHTIEIVLNAIEAERVNLPLNWTTPLGIQKAVEVFVGYLLLDAWIGNGDRHHENWGFVRNKVGSRSGTALHLSPTYDHASSLGRDLPDEKRLEKSPQAYASKCFSAFYSSIEAKKPLKTFDVFQYAAQRYPEAAHVWLERLKDISAANTVDIFSCIPSDRISPIAAEFAQKILEINHDKLLTLRNSLP